MFAKPQQKRYSVDRLRFLYASLLRCIDVNHDELCPRGIEEDDGANWRVLTYISSFTKLKRQPASLAPQDFDESNDGKRRIRKKQELEMAFRMMAATNYSVLTKESEIEDTANCSTGDVSLEVSKLASKLESTVTGIIQEIAEVVVNSQNPSDDKSALRSDDVFAYFCEKAILAMFVEMMMDHPVAALSEKASFNGVVWSPKVKAQILNTVSILVSKVRDHSALYYFLSQHCMNQLILCFLPLSQWNESALECILCPYTDLLKILSMQLSGSPGLFPFFALPSDPDSSTALFPLFSAVVEIATSTYAQTDSYVYATCLNIFVGLLRISHEPIRSWIWSAETEQRQLCTHLSHQLTERYRRIVNLVTGPVVDAARSKAISYQLGTFTDQLDVFNDLFLCNSDALNVRLCEMLLREFVKTLLRDLLPGRDRKFLIVGVSDNDVIPLREARAQVATNLLSRLFLSIEYAPFIRMLSVALFHPKSTPIWDSNGYGNEYVFVSALNNIVIEKSGEDVRNSFREEIFRSLSGEYGEWRVVSTSALLENAFRVLDDETLTKIEILPMQLHGSGVTESALENALTAFLNQEHMYLSSVSTMACECVSSLAATYIAGIVSSIAMKGGEPDRPDVDLCISSLFAALDSSRHFFYAKSLQSLNELQVNDVIVNLIESVVKTRYKRIVSSPRRNLKRNMFVYCVTQYGSSMYCSNAETLVRNLPGAKWNDTEVTRFYVTLAFHFRAIDRIICRLRSRMRDAEAPSAIDGLAMEDAAEELTSIFCCLQEKTPIGADLDLHGRMVFHFTIQGTSSISDTRPSEGPVDTISAQRIRTLSEDMIFRESSDLLLVLDPTDMFIVKPLAHKDVNRGILVCHVPFLEVIAAAPDESRLHVAVKHDNVGCLIKNGNMVLTFDSVSTCRIVHQYLDRCRTVLREELHSKIAKLFSMEMSSAPNHGATCGHDLAITTIEIPHVKTY
jgi:Uncharacterised conserved protein